MIAIGVCHSLCLCEPRGSPSRRSIHAWRKSPGLWGRANCAYFSHVTLPLAARGIIAGTLLAFARALGEFGATIMVAGNIPGKTSTIALSIYQLVQLSQDSAAFRLLGVSVLMAFGAVWISEFVLRRRSVNPMKLSLKNIHLPLEPFSP